MSSFSQFYGLVSVFQILRCVDIEKRFQFGVSRLQTLIRYSFHLKCFINTIRFNFAPSQLILYERNTSL